MTGIAETAVCLIVIQVPEAIVKTLWRDHVDYLFPKTREKFLDKMVETESRWQFPFCFWDNRWMPKFQSNVLMVKGIEHGVLKFQKLLLYSAHGNCRFT